MCLCVCLPVCFSVGFCPIAQVQIIKKIEITFTCRIFGVIVHMCVLRVCVCVLEDIIIIIVLMMGEDKRMSGHILMCLVRNGSCVRLCSDYSK